MNALSLVKTDTLRLLNTSPGNPQARALVAAQTKLWFPEELKTYEDICTWLREQEVAGPDPVAVPSPVPPPTTDDRGPHITVAITVQENQYGTREFNGTNVGHAEATITLAELLQMALRSASRGDFYAELATALEEYGDEIDTELDRESMSYDGAIDFGETDDRQSEWSTNAARSLALNLLREHYPEEHARLTNDI